VAGQPGLRPSRQQSPRTTTAMATGSVRGKCSAAQAMQRRWAAREAGDEKALGELGFYLDELS